MRKSSIAAAALCLTVLGGCSDFLNSEKAVADPNAPTVANTNQLFIGDLTNIFANEEGPVEMLICEWMQQCAGINGRFVDTQGTYTIDASTFDTPFQNIYNGGGLIGLRAVESRADASGDKLYKGIAEVLEAMDITFAADIWGDIPYADAVGSTVTPAFEPQMQVYTDVLALLDKAIADIGAGGTGPGAFDLVYGGNGANWIEAAHTLKARIYLHQVEKLGNAQYTNALTEARKGISAPAHDWKTAHTGATSERNMWAQFQTSSFGNDLVAGSVLVNLMKAQKDPRLADYFGPNADGGFGGYDVTTGSTPADSISHLVGAGRVTDDFAQPVITYDETQLIIAEAAFQTGDKASAATAFNNVRTELGKATIASGALTLNDIMTEKYISLYQNPEVWNDYKRTCLPALKPARSKSRIPGRIFYGLTEEQTNPNTPASSAQNLFTVRNANDPNACS
ncbi:MAG TPA: SusD/RagB family nutrient-binding outer membrane lipoprotein [Gemmatimonadaceae bacterium]|nr:SusD/RagB family nutrient-binding outer membrane lipoprotein [Gemmatimonadaceae bacterium]